jgi:hypothetical protein
LESGEKRRIQRPRVPRTAKKIDSKKMEESMEALGVEIENKDEVNLQSTCLTVVTSMKLSKKVAVSYQHPY